MESTQEKSALHLIGLDSEIIIWGSRFTKVSTGKTKTGFHAVLAGKKYTL